MLESEQVIPRFTWWGEVPYNDALETMTDLHGRLTRGEGNDEFIYLEHPSVITYGRATPENEIHLGAPGIPRLAVPRGGLATYHAPGQLVGYIVMDLTRRAGELKPDIHAYLRALEAGLITFVESEFGLRVGRRDGFTGLWTLPEDNTGVPGRKLASIGVSARKWITSHGFALNIDPDMAGFNAIVPCGITDASMSSVKLELERANRALEALPMKEWAERCHRHISQALLDEYQYQPLD